jgi:hypothetical protein
MALSKANRDSIRRTYILRTLLFRRSGVFHIYTNGLHHISGLISPLFRVTRLPTGTEKFRQIPRAPGQF